MKPLLAAVSAQVARWLPARRPSASSKVASKTASKSPPPSEASDLAAARALTKMGVWRRDFLNSVSQVGDESSAAQASTYWSEGVLQGLGLEQHAYTLQVDQLERHVHPQDRQLYLDYFKHSRRPNTSLGSSEPSQTEIEVRFVFGANRVNWVRLQTQSLRDDAGLVYRQLGNLVDVTASKLAERRLLMQYAVTKVLADSQTLADVFPAILQVMCQHQDWVAAACWRVALDGQHMRCADTWALMQPELQVFSDEQRVYKVSCNANQNGLLTQAWQSAKPNWLEDVSANADYRRRASASAAGLRGAFVVPVVAGGEVVRLLEFYSHSARAPDLMLLELAQSLGHQIGQFVLRRNAESDLHLAHERIDMAARASGIGFWDGDVVTGDTHFSAEFANLLGFTPQEFPQSRDQFVAMIHPDDRAKFLAASVDGFKSGRTYAIDIRVQLRDASYRWFSVRAKASFNSAGRAVKVAGSMADIEQRKQLDLAKDQFVATISHEFKTPLTVIRGSLGLLDGGLAGDLSTDGKELVRVALSSSERLSRMVNDVVTLSKIESEKAALPDVSIELDACVDQAVLANVAFCSGLGVALRLDAGAPGAMVQADGDQLVQVLTNLISNAAKFSSQGQAICAKTERLAGRLRISIADQGRGVPPSFRSRIFQKFEQADASDARLHQGSGLGLSICRTLVTRMGGTVDYADRPGGGTVFFVDLPEATAKLAQGLGLGLGQAVGQAPVKNA